MATTNRPVAMTVGQLIAVLAEQAKFWTEREKKEFREAWLKSVVEFNRRTEEIRYANWKRS